MRPCTQHFRARSDNRFMSQHGAPPATLIEAVRDMITRLHYSPRTEEAYVYWIREFIRYHRRQHPRDLGGAEVTRFLNYLALERRVSASTQNQALRALVFVYRRVLGLIIPELEGLERAKRPEHLPVVLAPGEVRALLGHLESPNRLIGELLYGSGPRLGEVRSLWQHSDGAMR